ncbi:MAG: MarR family transcriptional regulator [Treponema sp.]|nr:MarR family transcriptional regulator [Treponema sp.]
MEPYPEDLLIAVANLYFLEDFTQKEIAERMGQSRIAVTRMLKRARDEGLVRISIERPLPEHVDLALKLERRFGLASATVVPTGANAKATLQEIGKAGARVLERQSLSGQRLGVAWSETVRSILPYVERIASPPLCVNELAGTYLAPSTPYGVSFPLAEKLGVALESIPMPVLVRSARVRTMMIQEPAIGKALENAAKVRLAIVGLGNVSRDSSIMKTGYIEPEYLVELKMKGAVGDILMRYYDEQGRSISTSFSDKIVSLSMDRIRQIPFVLALAFGSKKVAAIHGALCGRLIQGLVTDSRSAEALLRHA